MLTVVADGLESTSGGNAGAPEAAEGPVALEVLEARICDVAARIAVVTSHWLGLVTEFVDREGWRASGCRSAAHWLSWRCGLSLSTAYEQVRVARALTGLPRVRAEFDAGRVSYSKVRALTRIAECSDNVDGGSEHGSGYGSEYGDDDLVVLAASATAAQLDRIAAGVRRAHGARDASVWAMRRQLRWWYNDDGMLEGRFRLTPDEGAVVVQALNAAMDTLRDTSSDSGPNGQHEDERAEDGRATNAGADSSAEESAPTDGEGEPQSDTARSGSTGGRTRRRRGGLAADALGLLAETFLTGTPAFAHGGDKYRVIVYAHIDALTDNPAPPAPPETGETREPGETGTPAETGIAMSGLRPGGCELADGMTVPPDTARRIGCEAGVVALLCDRSGHPLEISDLTRFPSAATERAVRARDHDTCAIPGCGSRLGLQIHHIIHWADGGPTILTNLLLVCRFHHWLVHEGGFTLTSENAGSIDAGSTGTAPTTGRHRFVFRQPDGTPIPTTGHPAAAPSEPTTDGATDDPITEALRPVIGTPTIDPDPLTPPRWNGDPLHLDYAVSVITDAQHRRRTTNAA